MNRMSMVLICLLALSGCGGGEKTVTVTKSADGSTATTTTAQAPSGDEGEVEDLINRYYKVMATDAPGVCDLMTDRGKAQAVKEGGGSYSSCEELMREFGGFLAAVKVKSIDDLKVDGDTATAVARFAKPYEDQAITAIKTADGWRIEKEDDLGASDGAEVEESEPTAEVVKTWPQKWCQAQPGMTKAELYQVMGKPTSSSGDESASWEAFNYQFNAFFDVDGNVRQLDINTIQLSESERAAIRCDETRKAS